MKYALPSSLRRPEQRVAAYRLANDILRADRRRTRAQAMPKLTKKKAPQVSAEPWRLHLGDLKTALARKRRIPEEKSKSPRTSGGK
jgi:hypothetical protein